MRDVTQPEAARLEALIAACQSEGSEFAHYVYTELSAIVEAGACPDCGVPPNALHLATCIFVVAE